jgi:alpha-beta hydrolase superfamily lysophospholipase
MNKHEWSWTNAKGMRFVSRSWEPRRQTRAAVALVHGLGDHSERFGPVGTILARSGYALAGFDLRGHGRSDGPRGHTPRYEAFLDDLADFLDQVRARYPRRPVFLYGHSLGGNLVLNYILRRNPQLHGAIVTSPWLRVAFEPPPAKVALAKALERLVPAFSQDWGLEAAALSHDTEIVRGYAADPLVHGRISARMFVSFYEAGQWALAHAAEFPLPLLLMHGTADRVTSADASREFANRAGKTVTWRAWDGMYHEIHNESAREGVVSTMVRWMDARLGLRRDRRARAGQKASGMRKSGARS